MCFYCATNWKIHENYGLHFCFLQTSELILCCLWNAVFWKVSKKSQFKKFQRKWLDVISPRFDNLVRLAGNGILQNLDFFEYTFICLAKWDFFGDFYLTQRAERVGQWCYSWERKNNVKLPKHTSTLHSLQQSAWCVHAFANKSHRGQ